MCWTLKTHRSVLGVVHAVTGYIIVGAAIAKVGFDVAFVKAFGEPGVDPSSVAVGIC